MKRVPYSKAINTMAPSTVKKVGANAMIRKTTVPKCEVTLIKNSSKNSPVKTAQGIRFTPPDSFLSPKVTQYLSKTDIFGPELRA